MKRFRTPRELLSDVERLLDAKTPAPGRSSVLQDIADGLGSGRHYLWTAIYLVVGERVICQAAHGPKCSRPVVNLGEGLIGKAAQSGTYLSVPDVRKSSDYIQAFEQTRSELVVPIKIGGHVLGVLNIESSTVNGLASEDRVLLQGAAELLARFLSNRGKFLLMRAREIAGLQTGSTVQRDRPITAKLKVADIPFHKPAAETPAAETAHAGERSRS